MKILVNKDYEFYYLLSFDLWTFYLVMIFFYKDVIASFRNLLVLQGYLMGNNIVFMYDMDSVLVLLLLIFRPHVLKMMCTPFEPGAGV